MANTASSAPPYVSHSTFKTFLEDLALGIPDRIDRSVFDSNYSGTSASRVMSALKSLELIDAEGHPQESLLQLVQSQGEARQAIKRKILEDYYHTVFQLDLQHATRGQLRQALREFGTTDSMLVKCESFFIHAARDAGIPLSRHIVSHRQRSDRPRRSSGGTRSRSTTEQVQSTASESDETPAQSSSDNDRESTSTVLTMIDKLMDKYPDFDPTWSKEAQESWMSGMERLTENFISKLDSNHQEIKTASSRTP